MKRLIVFTFMVMVLAACGHDDKTAPPAQNDDNQTTENGQKEDSGKEDNSHGTGKADQNKDQNKNQNEDRKNDQEKPDTNPNTGSKNGAKSTDFNRVIPSSWNSKLPQDLPVTKGKYLTAITSKQQSAVTFDFYESNQKLAINDSAIKKHGRYVGRLVITNYKSADAASKEIDQTVFKDGEAVDLGHNITGYQDAGAGSLYTSWNEGRWAIIARSATAESEQSEAAAKKTVEYLETHTLPIPKQYGELHIDAEQKGSMAKWQKQNIVYSMTDFGGKTLEWMVKFK